MFQLKVLAAVFSAVSLPLALSALGQSTATTPEPAADVAAVPSPVVNFVGIRSYLVGDPGGTDRFQYGGQGVSVVRGGIVANLDPQGNVGSVVASFFYKGDRYVLVQDKMDRIVTNVELHGDSGMGPAVLPKVFTYVATWGPTTVWKNGKVLYENIPGHLMLTESVRDEFTHKVDFKGPKNVKDYPGSVANPNDTQVHFVVHTDDQVQGKFPPNSWFAHYMADVVITN